MHGPLEGIGTQFDQGRPGLRGVGLHPDIKLMGLLDHEIYLVISISHYGQITNIGEIEN